MKNKQLRQSNQKKLLEQQKMYTNTQSTFASTGFTSDKEGPSKGALLNPPLITAVSWSITSIQTGEMIWGKDHQERLEIASLTKVMTAYSTLSLFRLLQLNPSVTFFDVSAKATQTIGTSAGLILGDRLSVVQLLYGLLLPSGNDAAIVLAEGCGKLIIEGWGKCKIIKEKLRRRLNIRTKKDISDMNSTELFIKNMNRLAVKLGLSRTTYSNPHGLADKANKSTTADLGKLVHFACRDLLIKEIVGTREFSCVASTATKEKRNYKWVNTNILLSEGYSGFKTGITPTAGPCLIATRTYRDISMAITVLHCKTVDHRWKEVSALYLWAISIIDKIYASSPEEGINLRKLPLLFQKTLSQIH